MRARILCAVIAALSLSGCVDRVVESRVRSALSDAGLSDANAQCMASRMVDRLTIGQLRKLEELKGRAGESAKPARLRDYVERVRRVGDAEVIAVTTSSAALCAAGLG